MRSRNYNSSVNRMLAAGVYTVEAATYFAGQTGDFTLSVRPLQHTEDLGTLAATVDRSNSVWTSDHQSTQRTGSHARFHTFTLADVSRLTEKGIYSLNAYSVESIYYCSDAMNAVAQRQAESLGRLADQMVENAKSKALDELGKEDLAERMAARRCERKVREELQSQMPDWKSIASNPNHTITLTTGNWHQKELSYFQQLLADRDLEKIITRYPVRESGVLGSMVETFELNRKNYEDTLIARVKTDDDLAEKLRQLIQPLAEALTEVTNGEDS